MAQPVSGATSAKLNLRHFLCPVICMLHCAAIPSLLWLFPLLSETHFLRQPIFRQCVTVVCIGGIIQSLAPQYRRHGFHGTGLMDAIGLTILFTSTFILPDLCCESSAIVVSEGQTIPAGSVAGAVGLGAEYCSYFGNHHAARHAPLAGIYLATPLITFEQLKLTLSTRGMLFLESIYPWLSPFSAALIIVSQRLRTAHKTCVSHGGLVRGSKS